MKKLISLLTLFAALFAGCATTTQTQANAPKQPRKVGVQMFSLHKFAFDESIEKLKSLNLDGVECFPGQKLSAKYPNVKVGYKMNAEQRAYMKKVLKDAGLKMVSFGVTHAKTQEEIDKTCQFVKEMGGERILIEDPVYYWAMWDKACEKYGLTVLIHHHATNGSPFWDTDFFKKHVKGLRHIKYNPDPGHWARSGIDPVQSLKEVAGYVGGIHFKDCKTIGKIDVRDPVPYGEGSLDTKGMLAELDKQGFDGFYIVEYESDWENNVPLIAKCVKFLRNN